MKKIIFFLIIILIISACADELQDSGNNYLINGYITGFFEGKAILSKLEGKKLVKIDSVRMKKSKFEFKGKNLNTPELYYIQFGENKAIIEFFLENSDIQIEADINNPGSAKISGSETQNEYASFLQNNSVFENKQANLYKEFDLARNNNDTALLIHLDSTYQSIYREQINYIKMYVKENKNSHVAGFVASRTLANIVDLQELEQIVDNFDSTVSKSPYIKEINNEIRYRKNTQTGMPAPEIILPDTSGNSIALSDFKGKIILLDFWASWSDACRVNNIAYTNLLEKYREKGFEIFSVSLDERMKSWKNVIKTDKTDWIQVSDNKGILSEVVEKYNVKKIPTTFLIDREGIIIAKKLSIEKLELKLEELLLNN